MNKPIKEFTNEELLEVIRRTENSNVPGSQYQKACNEWQIRHQQKMLEATKKVLEPSSSRGISEIEKGMLGLLNDSKYRQGKRSFSIFQKRFLGLSDAELRKCLRNIGATAFEGQNGEELWGLRTRSASNDISEEGNKEKDEVGEIFKLQPELYGIGVNIKALFRFLSNKVNQEKKETSSNKKVVGGKNKTKEANWQSKYWWVFLVPLLVLIFGYVITEGKAPQFFRGSPVSTEPAQNIYAATSTINISEVFSKYHILATSLEQRNFLEKYKDTKIVGEGTFVDIDKPSDNSYLVSIRIAVDLFSCYFETDKETEQKLLLLKSGQKISFTGVFTMGATFGGGWSVRECHLGN